MANGMGSPEAVDIHKQLPPAQPLSPYIRRAWYNENDNKMRYEAMVPCSEWCDTVNSPEPLEKCPRISTCSVLLPFRIESDQKDLVVSYCPYEKRLVAVSTTALRIHLHALYCNPDVDCDPAFKTSLMP